MPANTGLCCRHQGIAIDENRLPQHVVGMAIRRLTLLLCFAAFACGETAPIVPPQDAGPIFLDGAMPRMDSDGDGFCDATELERGTDPNNPDTDSDGYPDLVEFYIGSDPTLATEPLREHVNVLRQSEGATVQVPLEVLVRGNGERFNGAFEGLRAFYQDGFDASVFYAESVASYGVPEGNVDERSESEELFRGVRGETLLGFEVRFAYDPSGLTTCIRAYPYRYNVKREDGVFVASQRRTLLVMPPAVRIDTGPWCSYEGTCR